jgi:thioredoxin 1
MSKPIDVDDNNFDQTVLKSETPVLVDFWAPWCRPCLMVAPIVEELADDYSGRASFVRINVDQNPQVASRYNIMSIPTLIIFKDGHPASHIVGFRPKEELKQGLDKVV